MSDIMRAIPFADLLRQVRQEFAEQQTIFQVKKITRTSELDQAEKLPELTLYGGQKLEYPLGVAAGPHTQLAQNIAACYVAGARFMEVKTIQSLYGEDLGIPRPCIRAEDEGYNVEWSSEFSPADALAEYVKGYFLCKFIAREYGLGDPDGFIINMSCGYNLEGIKEASVDYFIENMKDASNTEVFAECKRVLLEQVDSFANVDENFIENISPVIAKSLTLSTMHGCPPEEIEKMADYMLREKQVNLYVKCNPTLLGYDRVRYILDTLGFSYIKFGKAQFDADLKLEQAVPMLTRLKQTAKEQGLTFGVKLTNTFQTDITGDELPGQNMYMSGRSLFPLSIEVAKVLSEAFAGDLPMSFSGGADAYNIQALLETNICPITVCTVLLRPRGLNKLQELAQKVVQANVPASKAQRAGTSETESLKVDVAKIKEIRDNVLQDKHYIKTEAQLKRNFKYGHYNGPRSEKVHCRVLCQNCIDVCPNRANDLIELAPGEKVILHLDRNCNECGNCQFSCVEPCYPYRDRLTLFTTAEDFHNSNNKGLLPLADERYLYRFDDEGEAEFAQLPDVLQQMASALKKQRSYLLTK